MMHTFDDELMRSICHSAGWSSFVEPNQIGELDDRSIDQGIRLVKVRDYKDKYVLKVLQDEARRESPGFKYYAEGREEAMLAWSNIKGEMMPSGYLIKGTERPYFSKGKNLNLWYPETLTQIFVRKERRRLGIGMMLMSKHVSGTNKPSIWVESPKWETRTILEKLGFAETEERYELWQMMEGLTKWVCKDQ
jgi:GNAT superfamily N-acetyltransferase